MASPARIAAYNGSHVYGGLEKWLVELLAALRARGHEVMLYAREAIARPAALSDVPVQVRRLGGDVALHHAARFAWELRRRRFDALLLSHFTKLVPSGMAGALGRVPRLVAAIPSEAYSLCRWKYRFAFRRWVDAAAANADVMRVHALECLPGTAPERIVTIYNGVPKIPRSTAPADLRGTLRLPRDAFVVGSIARLTRVKRIDRLLAAVSLLPESVHCLQAGEGDEGETLKALAGRLGVASRVHFLGYVASVGDVYDACDVVTVCSDLEGMSNQMCEALACGIPVLSTDVSGAAEALDPLPEGTRPGWIVGSAPPEIAAALDRLRQDPELRLRMGEAGRRRARERFGFERMVSRWESLLIGSLDGTMHEGPSSIHPG